MTVRIEDTDRARHVAGCEEEILESLSWIGVEWQEGPDIGGPHTPYRQSDRAALGVYQKHADELIALGHAYWAFDTPQELEAMREFQQINKQPIGYFGGSWRDASPEQVSAAKAAGLPGVVRLKMPRERKIVLNDAIRGRVEFDAGASDDPVLIKADGMPTYHCAAMVDDKLMGTTHVIRGEEWISSAPKHVWLFEALGWEPPIFVHVPVIKGKDGSKLSKRHGDTRMLDYRAAGYLAEAVANFITLIGWAPGGDRELMTMDEITEAFSLGGLQPSPGIFDADKLLWMNGQYLRALSSEQLFDRLVEYVSHPEAEQYWCREDNIASKTWPSLAKLRDAMERDPDYVKCVLPLEQERVGTLAEFGEACAFFIVDQVEFDEKATQKWFVGQDHVDQLFQFLCDRLEGQAEVSRDGCEALIRDYAAMVGLEKLGPAVHPVRVALTGKTTGPGLFELMSVLGPERMIARLQRARKLLS